MTDSGWTDSLAELRHAEVRANPYPLYQRLRVKAPVLWDNVLACWVVTGYREIHQSLRDERLSSVRFCAMPTSSLTGMQESLAPLYELVSNMMVYMDGPDHTRLRGLVQRAFLPSLMTALEHRIAETIRELIDSIEHKDSIDIITEFSQPLTTATLAFLLGVPKEYWAQLQRWEQDLARVLGVVEPSPNTLIEAAKNISGYIEFFRELITDRRANQGNDLLSVMVSPKRLGEIKENEIFSTCQLLMMAGRTTTTHLIGNAVLTLLQNPRQLGLLVEQPALIGAAVEELARFNSSAHIVVRVSKANWELGGQKIQEGQVLRLVLAAAHRDPMRFPEPDRLDFSRDNRGAIIFGAGPHFCLGASLARIEMKLALSGLLARFSDLALTTDHLDWLETHSLHGLISLPISFRLREGRKS